MELSSMFYPVPALVGGCLIGTASLMRMLMKGQILGVSGVIKGVFQGNYSEIGRYVFLGGLWYGGAHLEYYSTSSLPFLTHSVWKECLGGLLVGLGAGLGNGCTSGHGVCGNARLSPRSMLYTVIFMASGFITASCMGTAQALRENSSTPWYNESNMDVTIFGAQVLGLHMCGYLLAWVLDQVLPTSKPASTASLPLSIPSLLTDFLDGHLMAYGLAISLMTSPYKVAEFLDLSQGTWDPSLMFTMGGALAVLLPFMQIVVKKGGGDTKKNDDISSGEGGLIASPLLSRYAEDSLAGSAAATKSAYKFTWPNSSTINWKLLVGGLLFGTGWGLSGMCPGPAIVALNNNYSPPLYYCGCMLTGLFLSSFA